MTKAELISELSISTGYDKKTVGVIVEAFTAGVMKNLVDGESVYIRGFGSFTTKTRAAKVARNILKQTTIAVPAHKIPSFKPAAEFKLAVRNAK
jgi:DNA-binding protein HU-beta